MHKRHRPELWGIVTGCLIIALLAFGVAAKGCTTASVSRRTEWYPNGAIKARDFKTSGAHLSTDAKEQALSLGSDIGGSLSGAMPIVGTGAVGLAIADTIHRITGNRRRKREQRQQHHTW